MAAQGVARVRAQVLIDAASGTSPRPGRPRPGRWSSFFAPVLAAYALSRLVLFGLALDAYGGHWTSTALAGIWDGRYYLRIAAHGYPTALGTRAPVAAFFPLYPLLVRGAATVLGGNTVWAGLAVSLVAGAGACVAVGALARDRAGEQAGVRAGWLMAFAPGAAFLSAAYADGLAISLGAMALIMLDRRRWAGAGVFGALATATAPLALPLVLAGAWAAWRSRQRRAWIAPVVASSGFVSYCLYLWARVGTPFAWFDAERIGWAHHVDLLAPLQWLTTSSGIALVETFSVVVALGGLGAMRRARVPATWWVFTLPFLASVVFDAGLWLTPRLLLSAFPLVPGAAIALEGRRFRVLVAASAVVMLFVLLAYTQRQLAGSIYQP